MEQDAGVQPVQARTMKRFQRPCYSFLTSMVAAFTTTLLLVVIAILMAMAFRPANLTTDEYIKIEEEGFMGHCQDCDDKVKYILVCDGEKQIWGFSGYMGAGGMIYYLMKGAPLQLEPVIDLDHWCNIQDLGLIMHDVNGIVWPFVLVLFNLAISVAYDQKSDMKFMFGWPRMVQRNVFAFTIQGFVFALCYIFASIADESEWNTAAQTVYVFTMMSYALYWPGRLLMDNGQYFKQSFTGGAITMACMLLLPLIYALILLIAFALEGRAFHPTGPMLGGVGWSVLEMVLVIAANVPVFYFVEDWQKQDMQVFLQQDVPIPDPLPPIYEDAPEGMQALPPPAYPPAASPPRALEDVQVALAPAAVPVEELGDPEYEEITI